MVESGPSLGEFLRQARESRGITIEQVASATKIGIRLLHSLEADHYADLPAKPFIRGFVTSYARFIGLDAKEILTRYSDFLEDKAQDRPNRDSGHSGYAFEKKEGEQSRTLLAIVMGGFVVVGGLLIFVFKPSFHHHRGSHLDKLRAAHANPTPEETSAIAVAAIEPQASPTVTVPVAAPAHSPSPQPVMVEQKPKPKPSPTPSPVFQPPTPQATASAPPLVTALSETPIPQPSASPAPSSKPDHLNSGNSLAPRDVKYKVVFKALASVWVRYQVDDRPMMKFILKKGKLLVLRASKVIRFQLSNPSSITLNYNGQNAAGDDIKKYITSRQGDATLFFPTKEAQANQVPFPGEKALPSTPGPVAEESTPVPSPSP